MNADASLKSHITGTWQLPQAPPSSPSDVQSRFIVNSNFIDRSVQVISGK